MIKAQSSHEPTENTVTNSGLRVVVIFCAFDWQNIATYKLTAEDGTYMR